MASDPPSPVQLLVILFSEVSKRVVAIYTKIEAVSRTLFSQIVIHPAASVILTLVLTILAGLAGINRVIILVATLLVWVVTFSWINTLAALQKNSPTKRFAISALLPALIWSSF